MSHALGLCLVLLQLASLAVWVDLLGKAVGH